MLYVVMSTSASVCTRSFCDAVKQAMYFGGRLLHFSNCCFHCSTDTPVLLGDARTGPHTWSRRGKNTVSAGAERKPCVTMHASSKRARFTVSTDQKMSVLFLMVVSAVMPTRDLPAPHGSTMMPLRARPFPNILLSDFSW